MAVSSKCQGLGVGKQLLHYAIFFTREEKYERVVLETSHNQQQAISFYGKNGFSLLKTTMHWHAFVPFYIYRFQRIL